MGTNSETTIRGGGGTLFVRAWRPPTYPRAVIAVCHGFNSHSGYYAWMGEQCAAAGLAVHAVDLRGRGKSAGVRFYVESFDEYVADLAALVDHVRASAPDTPLFILGHSAGGVASCLYVLEQGARIAGLICEDFAFEVPAPGFALAVIKGISHIAPHARSLSLKNEDFTRDPDILHAMNSDPLIAGESQPLATMAAIVRADEKLKTSFPSITLPLLIMHGTADKAARASGSRHFHEQSGSTDKTLKLYDGRYHDPLNDIGREEVLRDMLEWIEQRIPG